MQQSDKPARAPLLVESLLEAADPIPAEAPLKDAIDTFRRFPDTRFLAVVDANGRPIGAVHESVVRTLLFSPFGHALLANPGCRWTLAELVHPCPSGEIDAPIEALIAAYAAGKDGDGMILTRRGRYVALLPSQALLRLAAERERAIHHARMAEAEAVAERGRRLEQAFEAFQNDASEFSAMLVAAAEEIQRTASGVAERATLNGQQAAMVASASAQSADGVAEVARTGTELARQVGLIEERVAEAKAALGRAVTQVEEGAGRARSLTEAADEIGGIVSLIAGLTRKVNMLAINAAIEAARAGLAGKGFGVVATEVKSLALQATTAARQIEKRVAAAHFAISETAEINRNINAIVVDVDEAATSILDSVARQAAATSVIAGTIEQAALASAEVSSHVADMGGRAETAGRIAARLSEVAETLGARAKRLRARVGAFVEEIRTA